MSKLHNKGGTAAATLLVFTAGRVAEAAHGARLEGVFHPTAAAPCTKAKAKKQYKRKPGSKTGETSNKPRKGCITHKHKRKPVNSRSQKDPSNDRNLKTIAPIMAQLIARDVRTATRTQRSNLSTSARADETSSLCPANP